MEPRERVARISGMNLETGEFPMTLATEGEASDGHILSIRGGIIPNRLPLQVSHINDPHATIGSIIGAQKHLKDSPPRLTANGRIELDGPNPEVRQDLAFMISQGHVGAVSIRWGEVPGKTVARINLPKDHPAYIDPNSDGPGRWGAYFEQWEALEGSVVAVGSDAKALIGRSLETEGAVRTFWRAMADDAGGLPDHESVIAALLANVRTDADACMAAGASLADVVNSISLDKFDGYRDGLTMCDLGGRSFFVPADMAQALENERINARTSADDQAEADPLKSNPDRDDPTGTRELDPAPATRIDWETAIERLFEMLDERDHARGDKASDLIQRILQEHHESRITQFEKALTSATGKLPR